jgi:glycosyltransferase involved in cell wall biosynthesis
MRILMVVAWDGGGIPTAMRFVADELRARGVTYSAFGFNGWNAQSRWGDFCENLYSNQEVSLSELLVRERFDVVHLTDTACPPPYNTNLWLKRARYSGGVVCMSQNTIQELLPDQFAHVFVACSEASRNVMARTISAEIRVIPNGVDTSHFYPRPTTPLSRPVLAWVGRAGDYEQKDIHGFLHLAANLYESPYEFWIADAGNSLDKIRLKDWFGHRIKYHSQLDRNELAQFYSDVASSGGAIISTSTFEGLPFSLLEAAACGCPVIAPNAPGMEYIESDKTGLLYERDDGVKRVNECLGKLRDSIVRERLICGAHEAIKQRYNSVRMAEDYFAAYEDSISRAKSQPTTTAMEKTQRRVWARALATKRSLRRSK